MRILLLDVNCKQSSTGKIVYDLYKELTERGHMAAVCYGRGKRIVEPRIYKFGLDWETYLHALLARITGLNGYFSFFSTRRLIKYVKKFNPDVIHLHETHAYFMNIKPFLKFLKKSKIRIIWTFHCEYMYTGKCGQAFECKKWKVECSNCPLLKEYPKSLFLDRTKKMYIDKKNLMTDMDMTIVTPSAWLASRVQQSFLGDKEIRVINNGINTDIFHYNANVQLRKKLGISEDKKIILSVAPNLMSELKGGKWVVELAERMQNQNVVFVLVGDKGECVEQKNIVCVGHVSDAIELAQYYSMADVFVICSKRETFPTTSLEAQCCGAPVVGFDAGGTKETVQDFPENFVTYGALDELEERIGRALLLPNDKTKHSQSACEKYDKSVMVENYIHLYADIIGDRKEIN